MAQNNQTLKKIPERRCVGCGEHFPKSELVRVLRTPEGEVVLDLTGKKSGRGAYICKKQECLEKCGKTKALNRVFKCNVPENVYEGIANETTIN